MFFVAWLFVVDGDSTMDDGSLHIVDAQNPQDEDDHVSVVMASVSLCNLRQSLSASIGISWSASIGLMMMNVGCGWVWLLLLELECRIDSIIDFRPRTCQDHP